jgi:hypothetical protein
MGEAMSESFKDFCLCKDTLSQFIDIVSKIALEGGRYRVTIKKWREKRSIDQNNLMWMWLAEIGKCVPVGETYFSDKIWHEYFKKYYCPVKIIALPVGQTSKKSTTLLDVGEMHFYLNKIEQWAIDKMLVLPMPDDNEYSKLKDQQNG